MNKGDKLFILIVLAAVTGLIVYRMTKFPPQVALTPDQAFAPNPVGPAYLTAAQPAWWLGTPGLRPLPKTSAGETIDGLQSTCPGGC